MSSWMPVFPSITWAPEGITLCSIVFKKKLKIKSEKRCFVWATIPRQDLFYSVYSDDDDDDGDDDDVDEKAVVVFISYAKCESI